MLPQDIIGQDSFQGIDMSLEREEDEIMVQASAGGRPLGSVLFVDYDGELMPQDLEVDERYRGQGIARTMYDYVKSLGYKIRRSGQQTDAGAGFWDKHKPGKNVWEQCVAEGQLDPYRLERLDPQTRRVLTRMADHKEPGSWLSASEAYAMSLGLQYKNRDPRGWEQDVQRYVDLYRQYSGQGVAEGTEPTEQTMNQNISDLVKDAMGTRPNSDWMQRWMAMSVDKKLALYQQLASQLD